MDMSKDLVVMVVKEAFSEKDEDLWEFVSYQLKFKK